MMRRILSMFGFSGYMPSPGDFGGNGPDPDGQDAPTGEARVTFLGGAKTPYSAEEAAEMRRDNQEEAGDKDLVWPGKPTTIGFVNQEPQAYRYNLTITNLPQSHYTVLPPTGGVRQPEGGVLLQPGEEASFEVRFPPVARTHAPLQSFHFVLTRFDPRRRNDPGVVQGEDAARWVPLPDSSDFSLQADVGEVRLRPWRRGAAFRLKLQDRSFLPADLNLHILRAPTRQALQENAESVDVISQPLEARMSGTWKCELPPTRLRNSYWATLRGSARVGEHQTLVVALPKPVYVRYVPWLRMGRDWAFLSGALFTALWLAWGIPVRHAPTVRMPLVFQDLPEGKLPPGGSWDDLNVQITSINDKTLSTPIAGVYKDNVWVFDNFPARWYGYRWPFASWSSWGAAPSKFKVEANVADDSKKDLYRKYSLGKLKSTEHDPTEFAIPVASRPFLGEWTLTPKAVARVTDGLRLNVYLDSKQVLAKAAQDASEIKLICTLDGEKVLEKSRIPSGDDLRVFSRDLDLAARRPGTLKVWAVAGQVESDPWVQDVQPRHEPFDVHLTFPGPPLPSPISGKRRPGEQIVITGQHLRAQGEVLVNDRKVDADWSPVRIAFNLPRDTPPGHSVVDIKPQNSAESIHVGTIDVQDVTPAASAPLVHTNDSPHRLSGESRGTGGASSRPALSSAPANPGTQPNATPAAQPGQGGPAGQPTPNAAPGGSHVAGAAGVPTPPSSGVRTPAGAPSASPNHSDAILKSMDYYELLTLDETDKALSAADAALLNKHARPDILAGAHAVKGMILLMRGQLSSEDEISQAMGIAQNLRGGRGRALAFTAQGRLAWKQNQPREQIMNLFTAAASADPKMVLSCSDQAAYFFERGYPEQAEALYRYGAIDNRNNPLFHYRFALLFRSRSDAAREQQEAQMTLAAEKNKAHKQILSDLLDKLNAS